MKNELIRQAVEWAGEKHSGCFRKRILKGTRIPYIVHPLEVMKMLQLWGIRDQAILSAAVCHDVLEENKGTSIDEVEALFGQRVAGWVDELTFHCTRYRKMAKARYLESFLEKSPESLVIKLADRFCNVADFYISDPEYATVYFNKAEALFAAWLKRESEIQEVFGSDVTLGIRQTYNSYVSWYVGHRGFTQNWADAAK